MARETVIVDIEARRQKALGWLAKAPLGFVVTFQRNKRSIPQNALMWSLLGHVSRQATLRGQKFRTDQWKAIFMQALGHEMTMLPTVDGNSWFPEGHRTSALSKAEMGDLIEVIYSNGAELGVDFEKDLKDND
jgi:hypothetical protein